MKSTLRPTAETASAARDVSNIWKEKRFVAAEIALLSAMFLLGLSARLHPGPFPGDLGLSLWWERAIRPNSTLTTVVEFFGNATWPLQAILIALGISCILGYLGRRLDIIISLCTAGLASLTNYTIMQIVDRPRPVGPGLHVDGHVGFPSFPSGHVEHAIAYYGFVLFLTFTVRHPQSWLWLVRAPLMLVIVMEGPSRLVTGEHWPSDILAALIWGTAWLLLAIQVYGWAVRRWPALVPPSEGRESQSQNRPQTTGTAGASKASIPTPT